MDLYTSALVLGAVGLALMAIGGLRVRGGDHGTHGSHGHGHTHGHGHGHSHGHPHIGARLRAGRASSPRGAGGRRLDGVLALLSPRVWFSVSVGFGAAGTLLRSVMDGAPLLAAALVAGVAFEGLLVAPFWRFLLRFASTPALTLETSVQDLARAVTSFDARGHGLVAIDLDGQVVQLLATLRPEDRAAGARVRAGDQVRIEDVDSARNRCTVSITRS